LGKIHDDGFKRIVEMNLSIYRSLAAIFGELCHTFSTPLR